MILLARLLSPQEFGLFAMVTAFTAFAYRFNDIGLSMATVQRLDIRHEQVSTLFWVNVTVGIFIAAITAALAPMIALFYGEGRLTSITIGVASALPLAALSVQHQALLRRQMRFGVLAVIDAMSLLMGAAVSIICAWLGASYWALVVNIVVMNLSNMVLVWSACGWRPGPPVWGREVRSMLSFGTYLSCSHIMYYIRANLDYILVGYRWGADSLGVYSKAWQLVNFSTAFFDGPLSSVTIPALSRLQDKPDRYRRYYIKSAALIVTFGMPQIAFFFVMADEVVRLLLGEQWLQTVPLFRALGPAAFVGTFNFATSWVFISLGRVDRQMWMGVWTSLAYIVAVTMGLHWGPIGVAVACSVAACGTRYPNLVYCYQGSPLKVIDLVGVLWRPAVASVAAAVCLWALMRYSSFDLGVATLLLICFTSYTFTYVLIFLLLPGGKQHLVETALLVKDFRRGSKR